MKLVWNLTVITSDSTRKNFQFLDKLSFGVQSVRNLRIYLPKMRNVWILSQTSCTYCCDFTMMLIQIHSSLNLSVKVLVDESLVEKQLWLL
jgi:hypothetical protein